MNKTQKIAQRAQLDLAESVLKGLLTTLDPKLFASALNNVCAHGEVFKENFNEYLEYNDNFLQDWFKGIETLSIALKRHDSNFYENVNNLVEDIESELLKNKKLDEQQKLLISGDVSEMLKHYIDRQEDEKAKRYLKAQLNSIKKQYLIQHSKA